MVNGRCVEPGGRQLSSLRVFVADVLIGGSPLLATFVDPRDAEDAHPDSKTARNILCSTSGLF